MTISDTTSTLCFSKSTIVQPEHTWDDPATCSQSPASLKWSPSSIARHMKMLFQALRTFRWAGSQEQGVKLEYWYWMESVLVLFESTLCICACPLGCGWPSGVHVQRIVKMGSCHPNIISWLQFISDAWMRCVRFSFICWNIPEEPQTISIVIE